MVHLFKGIQYTFEIFEWNFRDIGIRWFRDFGDTCTNCYDVMHGIGVQSRWDIHLGSLKQYFRNLKPINYFVIMSYIFVLRMSVITGLIIYNLKQALKSLLF